MSRTTTKIVIARTDGTILGQYVLGLGEHIIGREIDCAIYIDDPHVSRAHARLVITEEAVEIEDLNSTSGTYLDGVTVRGRIPVEPTQKVHISDLYIDIVREGFRELVTGARLTGGRFTLIKLLGQGGMGAVWLARDEVHEREVALKLLPAEMANDDSGLQDLEREVAKTATLDHTNILKIEGLVRTEDEPPFILMEYVAGPEALPGTDLDQIRRQTPNRLMVWSGVRHYMLQLCDALEYAHNKKIAHRDLKPSNLLINKQAQLKLADFGIAASIAGTASTMTVSVLDAGTPSYMSPQQIEGRQPQAADDIYSL
ncbi:MAG: serine/threonine-protein kinase [Verrucomicrobiota bacterium]|nr:serine/threonine-protein kinase [Verrucomicrobiota bacterium]